MSADKLQIRSYRRVFRIERRLYRIDRWTLPIPGGVPLLALGYFTSALLVMLALSHLPLISVVIGVVPVPLRYVVLPAALATIATQVEPDGRAPHRYLIARLTHGLRTRYSRCGTYPASMPGTRTPLDARLTVRVDDTIPALVSARVSGPALVAFAQLVEVRRRLRGRLRVRPARRGQCVRRGAAVLVTDSIALERAERLEIRS